MSFINFIKALTNEQALEWEGIISKNALLKALKYLDNDQSAGNDRITKEFYKFFLE